MPTIEILKSPLTNSPNVVLEKTIECEFIIDIYRRWLNLDVNKYFDNLKSIQIYRCQETGYRFYYPFNLEGSSEFYQALQMFSWYYQDCKWEFKLASKVVKLQDLVLEVGCGRGAFLDKIQNKGASCTGLEFNKDAIAVGRNKGLNIFNQTIQEHAQANPERYDVVCYFQVLEHVSNVKEFIQSSVDALKPGGKLIICVPNNDAFIKYAEEPVTNMPPHHMGLWNKKSLSNIQSLFNVKLESIHFEPLALEDCEFFYNVQMRRILDATGKSRILARVVHKFSVVCSKPLIEITKLLSKFIHGHSIIGVYSKLDNSQLKAN